MKTPTLREPPPRRRYTNETLKAFAKALGDLARIHRIDYLTRKAQDDRRGAFEKLLASRNAVRLLREIYPRLLRCAKCGLAKPIRWYNATVHENTLYWNSYCRPCCTKDRRERMAAKQVRSTAIGPNPPETWVDPVKGKVGL